MNIYKDFTIVIQGKLSEVCLDFYKKNYTKNPVIISTWQNSDVELKEIPSNFEIIKSEILDYSGPQNIYLQIESTFRGLKNVKTPFCVKMRGDEFYSNIEDLFMFSKKHINRIVSSPIYFRHPKDNDLHISDHLLAGKTTNLLLMFDEIEVDEKKCAEENLTRNYLRKKDKNYEKNILNSMITHFEIINLKNHIPYLITTNSQKVKSHNDFIPEKNKSISDISMIFNTKEEQNEIENSFR